ncbi:MAG: Cadherin-like beta sandwich domain protein [Mucilaginibacter sp.]|nr:Cadherin-like beta sandwich domain protein [Mucilaginibacter sp.]
MKRLIFILFVVAIASLTSCQKDVVTPADQSAQSNQKIATTFKVLSHYTINTAVNGFLRIVLAKDSVNKDDILIMFNPNTSPAFVFNEDASYFPGYGLVGFSSMSSNGVQLTIDKRPFPAVSTAIPLNVYAAKSDVYMLNLTVVDSIPTNYDIWLMDDYKKDSLDFRHNPTYAFNLNLADTNSFGSNRFSLVIRQNQNRVLKVNLLDFKADKAKGGVQFAWKTENEGNNTIFVLEKAREKREPFSQLTRITSSGKGTYAFLDKTHTYGEAVYRLKVISQDGSVITSKVVSAKEVKEKKEDRENKED